MKRNSRKAYTALAKLNAPVYDRQEYNAEFLIGGELRTADDEYFCDYWREDLREYVDANGKVQNPFGIRTDVSDILAANGLYAEWINGGLVGVYLL